MPLRQEPSSDDDSSAKRLKTTRVTDPFIEGADNYIDIAENVLTTQEMFTLIQYRLRDELLNHVDLRQASRLSRSFLSRTVRRFSSFSVYATEFHVLYFAVGSR